MPGGGYGGDSSVKWYLDVYNARANAVQSVPKNTASAGRHHQEGIDETNAGQRTFTISIMMPKDNAASTTNKDGFEASLRNAADAVRAAAANSNLVVRIPLPIEDNGPGHHGPNVDQIKVDW